MEAAEAEATEGRESEGGGFVARSDPDQVFQCFETQSLNGNFCINKLECKHLKNAKEKTKVEISKEKKSYSDSFQETSVGFSFAARTWKVLLLSFTVAASPVGWGFPREEGEQDFLNTNRFTSGRESQYDLSLAGLLAFFCQTTLFIP